jgi:hypothetical protein
MHSKCSMMKRVMVHSYSPVFWKLRLGVSEQKTYNVIFNYTHIVKPRYSGVIEEGGVIRISEAKCKVVPVLN